MGIPYVVSVLEVGTLHSASVPADNKQALSVRVDLLLLLFKIGPVCRNEVFRRVRIVRERRLLASSCPTAHVWRRVFRWMDFC